MDKVILEISLNEDGTKYNIKVPQGMSLQELMFSIAAMIKCLIRDGAITKQEEATELLMKYLTDSQYEEVKEENNESV